jgi:restriction system protein
LQRIGGLALNRRRYRRKNIADELIDLIPSIVMLIFLYLWFKFGNLTVPFLVLGFIAAIILGLAFYFYRKHKKKLMESGIDLIDEMSGTVFEELLMEHFKKLGYRAKMTAKTADYGADLILEKDDEKIVVQAKRWKQNVGVPAIQQVVAAIKHYQADKGMVISNSYFTPNAERLARSNNIELWDRDKLIDFLSKARGRQLSEEVTQRSQVAEQICPWCGKKLVLREGKRGKFWGCDSFPRCRFTKSYND